MILDTLEIPIVLAHPKFAASQDLPDFPYARYAELVDLGRIRVDTPEAVGPVSDAALASARPVVLEALTDSEIAAPPPHITFEQARWLTSALLGRDPGSRAIVRRSLLEKVADVLPHRG